MLTKRYIPMPINTEFKDTNTLHMPKGDFSSIFNLFDNWTARGSILIEKNDLKLIRVVKWVEKMFGVWIVAFSVKKCYMLLPENWFVKYVIFFKIKMELKQYFLSLTTRNLSLFSILKNLQFHFQSFNFNFFQLILHKQS